MCPVVLNGANKFLPQTTSVIYAVWCARMLSRPYVEIGRVLCCVFIQLFDFGVNKHTQVGAAFRSRLKSRFCAVFWSMYRAVG